MNWVVRSPVLCFWYLLMSSDMWFQFNLSCRRNPKNPENHIRSSWNRKSVVRYCTMDASRRRRSRRASSPCACMPRVSSWAAWLSTVDWSHGTFQHINIYSFLRLGDWGYKRSKSNCYANCTLLKIDGVRTKVFLCKHTIIHFQSFPYISVLPRRPCCFSLQLYRIRTPRGFVLTLGWVGRFSRRTGSSTLESGSHMSTRPLWNIWHPRKQRLECLD